MHSRDVTRLACNDGYPSSAGEPTETDYTAVGCAITTISSNLTEMSKGVKLLAALMEDDVGGGNDLMKAARTLAGTVSDLLKAVEPASGEVSESTPNSKNIKINQFKLFQYLGLLYILVPYLLLRQNRWLLS